MRVQNTELTHRVDQQKKSEPSLLKKKRKPYVPPQLIHFGSRQDLIERLNQLNQEPDADQAELARIRALLELGS